MLRRFLIIVTIIILLAFQPGLLAQAASRAEWAQFIADVTIPDGTRLTPGTAFIKTWRIKNIGTATWTTAYKLAFSSGEPLGAPASVNLPKIVAPGEMVDLTVNMIAPAAPGVYRSNWMLQNASGQSFGIGTAASSPFWAEVISATQYGVVYDFAANLCKGAWSNGPEVIPCPGIEGDTHGVVQKLERPTYENGALASQPGILMIPRQAYNGDIHGVFPPLRVMPGDRFQAIVNCDYGASGCYVTFRLDYQIGSEAVKTLWAFREKTDGLYYHANLNLGALAGQDVRFILTVNSSGFATGDRAVWGNPVIVRSDAYIPQPTATPIPPTTLPSATPTATLPSATPVTPTATIFLPTFTPIPLTETPTTLSPTVTETATTLTVTPPTATPITPTETTSTPIVSVTPLTETPASPTTTIETPTFTPIPPTETAVNPTGTTAAPTFTPIAPTDTPSGPTATPPTANPVCDRVNFIADVTIPDGTILTPGEAFTKTWRLQNGGSCTWSTAYQLVFVGGDLMSQLVAATIPYTIVPGGVVDVSVNMLAPTTPGIYKGYWKLQNDIGAQFGLGKTADQPFWVALTVSSFPQSSAYNFIENICAAAWSSNSGALACPGTDSNSSGFAQPVMNPMLENGVISKDLGLLTNPQGLFGGYIQGVYPPFLVQPGDRFQSLLNCEYGAGSCNVRFRLDYRLNGGQVQTLWYFDEKYDGRYYRADIDLGALAGQEVSFILTVTANGFNFGDRAMWVNPHIARLSNFPALTPTPTPYFTPTETATPEIWPTFTPFYTETPFQTPWATPTEWLTPTPSIPATETAIPTLEVTETATPTPFLPSETPTPEATMTPSPEPTAPETPVEMSAPTETPTPAGSN